MVERRECLHCGRTYTPHFREQRYCSRKCGISSPSHAATDPSKRKAVQPPYGQLMAELSASSYLAVARAYGVSDDAVRKWVRRYEREIADREQADHEEG